MYSPPPHTHTTHILKSTGPLSINAKPRQSNIELLRILAMLLVLVVHANFFSLGKPTYEETVAQPMSSFLRFFVQSLSVFCVNVFVLISGWFGIRPKVKSMGGFLFQCLFFGVLIHALMLLLGKVPFTRLGLTNCILITNVNWFVIVYLLLCLFAPMLNDFVERYNERTLRNVIIAFYGFQTVYAWLTGSASSSLNQYSALSLMGLYLLARYVRLYPSFLTMRSKTFDLLVVASIVIVDAAVVFIGARFNITKLDMLFSYISPTVVVSALYLLLYFTKIQFYSKFVNWVAASSFAAFLLHMHLDIVDIYYRSVIQTIYAQFQGLTVLVLISIYILSIFIIAILFDQLRKFCWNFLWYKIEKEFLLSRL